MTASDGVRVFDHDHADINRQVVRIAATMRALANQDGVTSDIFESSLAELRELMFLHFAREEEGLFPFLSELAPDLAGQTERMAIAHEQICAAVTLMVDIAASGSALALLASVFERFQAEYSEHATAEARLLVTLDERLDHAQRARLAELIEGL